MTDSFHDFFLATAGAAAALIGLLFVAISVAPERITGAKASTPHQVRASTALDALVTPLVLALVALLPAGGGDDGTGIAATCFGTAGLLYVAGSVVRLVRAREREHLPLRSLTVVVGLMAVTVWEIVMGVRLIVRPSDTGALQGLAGLLIASLAIGVDRAWELVGAGSTGVVASLANIVGPRPEAADDGARGRQGDRPS